MQSRSVLDRQEHVLHRSKCGNLMLNLFILNTLSDDITSVYVICANVIGPKQSILEHIYLLCYVIQKHRIKDKISQDKTFFKHNI